MDQRSNFLALILLDALEDENEGDIMNILERNDSINPSYVPPERGISPMHYACGMDNAQLGLKITKIFLKLGANPNVCSAENVTPLHVASMHGRLEIVRLLLEHGAKLEMLDNERKLPIHYAIEECHFEILQLMRDHIFLKKYELSRSNIQNNDSQKLQDITLPTPATFEKSLHKRVENKKSSTPNEEICNKHLQVPRPNDKTFDKFTPNRVHYNYDVTSPYYINITHRRNKPQPKYPSPEHKCNSELHNISAIIVDSSPEVVTQPLNIFSLTKENLTELSQANQTKEHSRTSLIELWREKVKRSNARKSILREFDNVKEMVQTVMENDHLDFTNTRLLEKPTDMTKIYDTESDSGASGMLPTFSSNENLAKKIDANLKVQKNHSLGELIQCIAKAQLIEPEPSKKLTLPPPATPQSNSSYQTVPELTNEKDNDLQNTSNFIRSPNAHEYYLAMTEAYVHTDDENGLVFYETKLLSNHGNRAALQRCDRNGANNVPKKSPSNLETTFTSQSTDITIPLDYETDALRAELTTFGEAPGPITKSTKRLYIKRLIKMKRKTAAEIEEFAKKGNCENKIKFSVELYRSVRSLDCFRRIVDYMKYDNMSTEYFANNQNKRTMREGHLKQSFIYMLIDPRISNNLPGESIYMEKFEIWKRFLDSIFYVGKGKTSRPYCHLYDAMKLHSRLHNAEKKDELQKNGKKVSIKKQKLDMELFRTKSSLKLGENPHSQKINRILDIWASNRGVVCLHVFHNIMPTEAYTREAAIIDALGLQHLTNIKRGDYYGPAKNWTMKEKKFLGIALLFKAMKIYLAEGESQLSPSDLI